MRFAKKVVKSILLKGSNPKTGTGNAGKYFMMIRDKVQPEITVFAQDLITEDGHPMTNPVNNDWCVNDTYPDSHGVRTLMLYQFSNNRRIDIGHFQMIFDRPDMGQKDIYFQFVDTEILRSISPEELAFTRSGLHCDLHPRWTRDGKTAVFDSIHEGSRQLYSVNVEDIIR